MADEIASELAVLRIEFEHLYVGDLLKRLADVEDKSIPVQFGFGAFAPIAVGAYADGNGLALWYDTVGTITVAEFVESLTKHIGTEVGLYGSIAVTESTPVWVANDRNLTNCGVIGVTVYEDLCVLETTYIRDGGK